MAQLNGIDLDLTVHGFVETVNTPMQATALLTVTKRGVMHLSESRQALIAAQRPHHKLGARLAAHLQAKGLFTWENVEFANPCKTQEKTWGVVRPDVYACKPTMTAQNAASAIYEVKVSRADFLADIAKPEKRAAYSQLAEAVYYCCQEGVISKNEVPDGFGLLVEASPGNFLLQKKAKRAKDFQLDADTAMTLMIKRQVPLCRLGQQ